MHTAPLEAEELAARLHKVEGQVRGVAHMLAEGAPASVADTDSGLRVCPGAARGVGDERRRRRPRCPAVRQAGQSGQVLPARPPRASGRWSRPAAGAWRRSWASLALALNRPVRLTTTSAPAAAMRGEGSHAQWLWLLDTAGAAVLLRLRYGDAIGFTSRDCGCGSAARTIGAGPGCRQARWWWMLDRMGKSSSGPAPQVAPAGSRSLLRSRSDTGGSGRAAALGYLAGTNCPGGGCRCAVRSGCCRCGLSVATKPLS